MINFFPCNILTQYHLIVILTLHGQANFMYDNTENFEGS